MQDGWEVPACALCGSGGGEVIAEARDLNYGITPVAAGLVRCTACGIARLDPRPDRETIGGFYPSSYDAHRTVAGSEKRVLTRRSRRFDPVASLTPGRYLDVGCGSGYDLLRMREKGWTVAGFEVSEQAAKAGRELGLEIRHGAQLAEAGFEGESFDLVTMFCVLPHLHDPMAALAEVRRLLRPGGTFFMTVPRYESLNFRLFKGRWYHLDAPRHLWFFSDRGLKEMAGRAGFHPEGRRFRSGVGGFKNSLAHVAASRPSAAVLARVLRVRPARWLMRCLYRFVVDPVGLGDTVDVWWRRT